MLNKVVIVGVGLLGGSIARDLRQQGLASEIVGVCRSESARDYSLQHNIVDKVLPIEQAVAGADLVIFATPMQAMLPLLEECAADIPLNAIITDVGSVKTSLYAAIKESCPELLGRFVLAHPIAGAEDSGVSASRLGLFSNKHLIITSTDEVKKEAIMKVEAVWLKLGARVMTMSLQQHDAIFSKTSHLPHVVAFSLVNFLNQQSNREQLFELAAAGFYDFTRIASSSAVMWRDICVTNRTEVLAAIDGYTAQLLEIRQQIAGDDQQQILDYFDAAKQARDAGLSNKRKDSN